MKILVLGGSNNAISRGYLDHLVREITQLRKIPIELVENRAVGGSTCVMGLEVLKAAPDIRQFDCVLIEYCINDRRLGRKESWQTWQGCFEAIIRTVLSRAPAANVYVLKFGRKSAKPDHRQIEIFGGIDRIVSRYAERYSLKTIDVDAYLRSLDSDFTKYFDDLYSNTTHYSRPVGVALVANYVANFITGQAPKRASGRLPPAVFPWALDGAKLLSCRDLFPQRPIKVFENSKFRLETVAMRAGEEISLELPGSLISITFSSAVDSGTLIVREEGQRPIAFETRHNQVDGKKFTFLVVRQFTFDWKTWAGLSAVSYKPRKLTLRVPKADELKDLPVAVVERYRMVANPAVPENVYIGRLMYAAPAA